MRVGVAPLDYYSQNDRAKWMKVGQVITKQNVDMCGLTEVRSDRMDEGIREGLGPAYTFIEGGESPQVYNHRRWKRIGEVGVDKFTRGIDGITPDLFVVTAMYQKVRNPRKRVAFLSTHLVPLTQDGKPRKDRFAKRMQMWNEHWNYLKALVRDLTSQGFTVIVAGDFNNILAGVHKIKEISPRAKWIIRKGLSWVFAVEGSTKIRRMGITRSFRDGSDHLGWWREVILA